MEALKIDRSKLMTVQDYAKDKGISRPTVYKMIREGELKETHISNKRFVITE